jgi:hypothetical protein
MVAPFARMSALFSHDPVRQETATPASDAVDAPTGPPAHPPPDDSLPETVGNPQFGVGVRVFSDRALLRQIRKELARNAMRAELIARLENVTAEALLEIVANGPGAWETSSAALRDFAISRSGFRALAWRTSRRHVSKLHVVAPEGAALCGTPLGTELAPVHAGPCVTCGALARAATSERGEEPCQVR